MGYNQVEIDVTVTEHWNMAAPHAHKHKHCHNKWENPQIEKVFADKLGHHDWLYCVHVKTGKLGNHHHFTIVYEIRKHECKLLDVHEGHKTFWWFISEQSIYNAYLFTSIYYQNSEKSVSFISSSVFNAGRGGKDITLRLPLFRSMPGICA